MSIDSNLPVKSTETFLAENEVMDLSPIKDKMFLVAVSTGDRNKSKFLSTTVRGPYSYTEMLEEVGVMWKEHQHHAKAVILSKDRNAQLKSLDENTIDYIECHYLDLITDAMLEGMFDKEYTCQVGIVETESEAVALDSAKPDEQ
jgi:hypothetical protein